MHLTHKKCSGRLGSDIDPGGEVEYGGCSEVRMGKEQQNLEIHYHPEDRPGVTVVLHWGRYGIDARVTVPVERWQRLAQLARVDLDAAAGELLSIAGVEVPIEERAAVIDGYGRSLKVLLVL